MFTAAQPAWARWASHLLTIWFWSEFVVLLLNEKRRALHDFFAGTVVLHLRAPAHVPRAFREEGLVQGTENLRKISEFPQDFGGKSSLQH